VFELKCGLRQRTLFIFGSLQSV